jgi:hypothetical protein
MVPLLADFMGAERLLACLALGLKPLYLYGNRHREHLLRRKLSMGCGLINIEVERVLRQMSGETLSCCLIKLF